MRKLLFIVSGMVLGYLLLLIILIGGAELLPGSSKGGPRESTWAMALDVSLIGAIIGAALGWFAASKQDDTGAKRKR